MLTLEYKAGLTENPFSTGNNFLYGSMYRTGIFYTEKEEEWPYILTGAGGAAHPNGEILYSNDVQFNSRHLTPAKVKEILDAAKAPIKVTSATAGITYLIGKGFLGYFQQEEIKMLLLAVCNRNEKITSMSQIKLIASKEINQAEHKRVSGIVKDIYNSHPGDVLITGNIDKYIGHRLIFPIHKTISEKKQFEERVIKHCISMLQAEVGKPIDKVQQEMPAPF